MLARQPCLSCNGIHDITHRVVGEDDSATMLAVQGMIGNNDVGVLVMVTAACTHLCLGQLTQRKSNPQPNNGAPGRPWDGELPRGWGGLEPCTSIVAWEGCPSSKVGVVVVALARISGDGTTELISTLLQPTCLQAPGNGSEALLWLNTKCIVKCGYGRL